MTRPTTWQVIPVSLFYFEQNNISKFDVGLVFCPFQSTLKSGKVLPPPSLPEGVYKTLNLFPLFCMKLCRVKVARWGPEHWSSELKSLLAS